MRLLIVNNSPLQARVLTERIIDLETGEERGKFKNLQQNNKQNNGRRGNGKDRVVKGENRRIY